MGDIIDIRDILGRVAHHQRVRALLEDSQALADRRAPLAERDLEAPLDAYPRFASGIPELDQRCGGFQGLTVVGGEGGAGKSTLALGAALTAAHAGDCVLYCDAENGAGLVRKRIQRWYGPGFREEFSAVSGTSFWYVPFAPENRLADLPVAALERFRSDHTGLLFVLDSYNSIVDDSRGDQNEFAALRSALSWADWLVRSSNGYIRFLFLSEVNRDGRIYGAKAQYRGQCVITMRCEPDLGEDRVRLVVSKNRDGWAGDLGVYERDWRCSTFRTAGL